MYCSEYRLNISLQKINHDYNRGRSFESFEGHLKANLCHFLVRTRCILVASVSGRAKMYILVHYDRYV